MCSHFEHKLVGLLFNLLHCVGNFRLFSLQEVEIVLTAHPTQINRRTLQYKHIRIAVSCLADLHKNACVRIAIIKLQAYIRRFLYFFGLFFSIF